MTLLIKIDGKQEESAYEMQHLETTYKQIKAISERVIQEGQEIAEKYIGLQKKVHQDQHQEYLRHELQPREI